MTNEEKEHLVSTFISGEGRHPEVFDTSRMLSHIADHLRQEGVDESTIAVMHLLAVERMRWRRTLAVLSGQFIQVQPLPQGAQPIYDRDPDVASIVRDDD